MAHEEYKLSVINFKQFSDILKTFSSIQNYAQINMDANGMTMFAKLIASRADLYSDAVKLNSIHLEDKSAVVTAFIPDIVKFLKVLNNIGKYFNIEDNGIFQFDEVKLFISVDHFRIVSSKYSIKYQFSTSAIQANSISNSTVLTPSHYSQTVRSCADSNAVNELYLIAFKISANQFRELDDLLGSLSDSKDATIKIQTIEQAKDEKDVVKEDELLNNTLYATISDNKNLLRSNIGNKINVKVGKIILAKENYQELLEKEPIENNFIYMLNSQQLITLAQITTEFGKYAQEIEGGFSKVNLMHLNLIIADDKSKSEIYLSAIGQRPTNGLISSNQK